MTSERVRRMKVQPQAPMASDYVGAHFEDDRRVVLVSVDPEDPWAAFRRLRKVMRATPRSSDATIGMYASDAPLGHQADVISLHSRRRAG